MGLLALGVIVGICIGVLAITGLIMWHFRDGIWR
jgi:hypothetical protein